MFTGIIQHLGEVTAVEPTGNGKRLTIDLSGWRYLPEFGASIAINGCCLTVADAPTEQRPVAAFDIVPQTLRMTTFDTLVQGDKVNLERSVALGEPLDGHLVQGHVDGIAHVTSIQARGQDVMMRFRLPLSLMEYIIPKGSIAIAGVSLTIAEIDNEDFAVALIPTTLKRTMLGELAVGSVVNVETDQMARTIVHWLRHHAPDKSVHSSL